MRGLLLTILILGTIPFILKRAYLGALVFAWISIMNPHRLTFGFAATFPFAAIIACVTLVAVLLDRERKHLPSSPLMLCLYALIAWVTVTTVFALQPEESWDIWRQFMKIQLMVLLTIMMCTTRERLIQLIWVIVLSLGYFGVKGGIWSVLTGGVERVWGPPGGFFQDNNALAVGLVMTIPMMRYLQMISPKKWVRWGLGVAMLTSGASVLGTYSRGALLAGAAMLVFLWLKGRHKLILGLIVAIALPVLLAAMPEKWDTRMSTIATYEEDTSATARLHAWDTMFNLAKDRPITGGGFSIDNQEVYERYATDRTQGIYVAHSIYFQALGGHGFIGLLLLLLLFIQMWRSCGWVIRNTARRDNLRWAHDLAAMTQVSLIGFMVGGAFLSLLNADLPYYFVAIIVLTQALVRKELDRAPAPADRSRPSTPSLAQRLRAHALRKQ